MSILPRKVLCPVDFTPASDEAMDSARELAAHFHATLCLANVVPALPSIPEAAILHEGEYERNLIKDAEARLAIIAADLTKGGVETTSVVGVGNDVAGELLRIAKEQAAELIVIPTRGMTGWHPLVFESIAAEIVKHADCPVLVLRAPKK